MSRPPVTPAPQQANGWGLVGVGLVIVLAISGLGRCNGQRSTSTNTSISATQSNFAGDIGDGVAAQPRQAPTPLGPASITRAAAHVRLAMRDEGALGAQTYSQNCYDALSRSFSWDRLDVCGAFDVGAGKALESGDAAGLTQADYFESEVIAGRYLAAATGAGLEPGQADQRFSQLQSRASRPAPAPRPARPKVGDSSVAAPASNTAGDEAAETDAPPGNSEDADPIDD